VFHVGGPVEGFVVDPDLGFLYVGEEQVGVWQYPLAPDSEQPRRLVDTIRPAHHGPKGNLAPDVEGITLYDAGNRQGWLIVSCQSEDRFAVYDRATLAYGGSFALTLKRADGSVDRVTHTDGIHATATPLGPRFPRGMFIAQDDNDGKAQNFKLVSWSDIADAMSLNGVVNYNADSPH
jgi:myo-inositol-hexaphosphate 3-phosphohydrolase